MQNKKGNAAWAIGLFSTLVLAVGTAGCKMSDVSRLTDAEGGRTVPVQGQVQGVGVADEQAPRPATRPEAEAAEAPRSDQAAKLPPKPRPRPRTAPLSPEELKGLTRKEARALFGTATIRRDAPPATVWTYEHAGCRLRLYYYPDVISQEMRALSVELESDRPGPGARSRCLMVLADRDREAGQTAETPPSSAAVP